MSDSTIAQVTRWWWVRHAPVTSHDGRIYGQGDVPANVSDRAAFAALARLLPTGAIWVTSHLRRTQETAQAVADAGHWVPTLIIEPDLAEQDFGAWQGLRWSELPQVRGGAAHSFWVAPAHQTPPGGESFLDVIARVGRAIARLGTAHVGRDLIVVGHGGSIRAALALALEIPPERALAFTIDNLSLTRIDHFSSASGEPAWRVGAVNHPPIVAG